VNKNRILKKNIKNFEPLTMKKKDKGNKIIELNILLLNSLDIKFFQNYV